jgi:pyruvate,water dikinase
MHPTPKYVLELASIDRTTVPLTGGKAANLGELTRIEGIRVPDGFCISTEAFARVIAVDDRLSAAEIRRAIEATPIPEDIRDEITRALRRLGDERAAYAVRSSATAEDLPTASFAGQQDSFLNVVGAEEILKRVSQCWASLFTDRAVAYRREHGFDHRQVRIAVIVQRMVVPEVAGVLFTADPITGNRRTSTVDAVFGLGDTLVSGHVNADVYRVRNGTVIDKRQDARTLTDDQLVELEKIGRTIEAHVGRPQDIEWCWTKDGFHIVQSRPITTLYPIPDAGDHERHVYVSVGHQQMMTDPMKPLGLSFFQLTARGPKFKVGGGRLFVDVIKVLASTATRQNVLDVLGQSDPLIKDALVTLLERGDFIPSTSADHQTSFRIKSSRGLTAAEIAAPVENDPDIVRGLIEQSEANLAALREDIRDLSGPELLDFIRGNLDQFNKLLADPKNMAAIIAGMHASAWINDKMLEWLGEKNAADVIAQSVPDNVTSEMGLALLDVADVVRRSPAVVEHLQHTTTDDFLDGLTQLDGGPETRDAIQAFLAKYGMRCPGEIDVTRPRWSEKPSMLVPLILGNVKSFAPHAGRRKIEQGRRQALEKEQDLLERLERLPDGERKAAETKQMIDLVRRFMGYREYPKYAIVKRYFVYKRALLKEAAKLVAAGVIDDEQDVYFLTFDELHEAVRTRQVDRSIIDQRKADHESFEKLTPPRVITSDGEIVVGKYKRENLPPGAIVGLAVSSGVTEGRARVVFDMEHADLEEGDILVTTFTDPSWTPLFVSIRGLVTEVGGLMTHGAVIAREYGLPAVVGVEHATQRIQDGQRIRLNGTDGYVELLDEAPS